MSRKASPWDARSCRGALAVALAGAVGTLAALTPATAHAQAYDCNSPDPADWPPPAKPYFMIAFDTSGSMDDDNTLGANSCGYPTDRLGHGRCAVKNTLQAFSGQANFGLASFARVMTSCPSSTCYTNCNFALFPGDAPGTQCTGACGPEPAGGTNSSNRAGANMLVGMLVDSTPPGPTNLTDLLDYVDNNCTGGKELFATGCTPLNGILRDMYRYYSNSWTRPGTNPPVTFTSPLRSVAQGERACRSVNVILVTDGGETCDQNADAVDAAADLYAGFTKDGINWRVRTFVIDFGDAGALADQIANAGGTGSAQTATNEASLSIALSNIISGAIAPEVCNNADDNCNGCVDEGYKHYCNVKPAGQCCAWATPAQRQTCLTNYQGSINAGDPDGNLTLLPCTTPAQQSDPNNWLCYNPGELCDNADNNCDVMPNPTVDEGVTKCGNPLACPTAEVCDGLDNDCDGAVDEAVCAGCVPSAEICDGCDNDCDGVADEGIAPIACGLPFPANCTGQLACNAPQPVPQPGGCVSGGGYGQCSNNPLSETCDGIDNDCDGSIDEGVAPTACVPPGTPGGLVYGGSSQCQMGSQPCNGQCTGFVGPTPEICDGIDNDCDGTVDDGVLGVGQSCGINQPPCQPGATACVNGALVCQGGVGPQAEQCDGIDNNCNGAVDESPLADAPAAGQNGCWVGGGNCCSWPPVNPDVTWCPPQGATCTGNGTLSAPCNRGTLFCSGGVWQCTNANAPSAEVCDGVDNNCNAQIDEGNLPQEGMPCGSDVGECSPGVLDCTGGVLDCVGDTPPSPELCDGLDNNCNTLTDDGVQAGGPCTPAYDTTQYPGPRNNPPCAPGVQICDAVNGLTCVGGITPNPEVCDGIDNDCDGTVDEAGPAPDGTDGQGQIGQPCGVDTGECAAGTYTCLNGIVQCVGGQGPQPEQCDCLDNDCDGTVDNAPPSGNGICGSGKECVSNADGCVCAEECGSEIPCPPGQVCGVATNQSGMQDDYCLPDYQLICGDCAAKTVTDANGAVVCAPPGTPGQGCLEPPVCTCKNQNGCREPCLGVVCPGSLVCSNYGPNAGACVADTSCWNFPCAGCDEACHNGACVNDPCEPNPCQDPSAPVCKPSADWTGHTCVPSCAGVQCPANEACVDGVCGPTCAQPCATGQGCDTTQSPPQCVQCAEPCLSGCCNPMTGQCGDCPCEGVSCPDGQVCRDGSCFDTGGGTGGGGGGQGGGTGQGGGASTTTGATGGQGAQQGGVWGVPTGGGGCACELGAGADAGRSYGAWALLGLGLILARRRGRRDGKEVV